MAKYLYRTCPKCKNYPGVVVPKPPEPVTEVPIDARCLRCGYKLAWQVVTGRKSILALLWLVLFHPLYPSSVYPLGERQPQFRTVRRVVDGDTLVLENKERVRLIGVDTPETKHPRKPVEYYGRINQRLLRIKSSGKDFLTNLISNYFITIFDRQIFCRTEGSCQQGHCECI